jgi:hypothetical protein
MCDLEFAPKSWVGGDVFESRGYVFGYVLGCVCVFAICAVVEFFLQVEKNRMGRIFWTLS